MVTIQLRTARASSTNSITSNTRLAMASTAPTGYLQHLLADRCLNLPIVVSTVRRVVVKSLTAG
jgi:hypothetical protein